MIWDEFFDITATAGRSIGARGVYCCDVGGDLRISRREPKR